LTAIRNVLCTPRPTGRKLMRLVTVSALLHPAAAPTCISLARQRVTCSLRFCPRTSDLCAFFLPTTSTKSVLDRHLQAHARYHERITDEHHVLLSDIPRGFPQCYGSLLCSTLMRQQHSSHGPMLRRLPSLPLSLRWRTRFRLRQHHRFERALVPRRE
jgi:hypothetical protein